ncbi:MAG: DUF1003 domain-containing protein [Verrucomicrobium sp.]|nr:DUF1003 domain-containing protein [Verrucomicrobium sp.]
MPYRNSHEEKGVCQATQKTFPRSELIPLGAMRPVLAKRISQQYPELTETSLVSHDVLNSARLDYVRAALQDQLGELTHLDEEVVSSLHKHEVLSERPLEETEEDKNSTFGQRVADKIAEFGGSWTFILSFLSFLLVWIGVNVFILATRAFDPYPFILLNLLLSCIAALQAPVIMMSQNRQETRDRQRAENDYKINLKSELEIRHLHEKMDYLLHQQATRLLEIQEIQLDMMRELTQGKSPGAQRERKGGESGSV